MLALTGTASAANEETVTETFEKFVAISISLWCIYNGCAPGSTYRSSLPGSSQKGAAIPTWLGRAGFISVGLFIMFRVFKS